MCLKVIHLKIQPSFCGATRVESFNPVGDLGIDGSKKKSHGKSSSWVESFPILMYIVCIYLCKNISIEK